MIDIDSLFKPGLQVFEYELSEAEIKECDKIKNILEKESLWSYSIASVVFEIRNDDERAYIAGGERRNCIIAIKDEEREGFNYFAFERLNDAFYVIDFKNDILKEHYPTCNETKAEEVSNAFVHYLIVKSIGINDMCKYIYKDGMCLKADDFGGNYIELK